MNRSSNKLLFSKVDGDYELILEKARDADPFTQVRNYYSGSDTTITCYANGFLYGDSDYIEEQSTKLVCPISALLDMVNKPFFWKKDSVKNLPHFLPTVEGLTRKPLSEMNQYKVIVLEFILAPDSIPTVISKILSEPYIGQFGIYPKVKDIGLNQQWVLFIPLNNMVSRPQYFLLQQWLEQLIGVKSENSTSAPTPCPSLHIGDYDSYYSNAIAVKDAHALPAIEVLHKCLIQDEVSETEIVTTIDLIEHFNTNYDWGLLLLELGFCRANKNEWCLPNSKHVFGSAKLIDNKLHILDHSAPSNGESMTKFEVAMKWRKQQSILPVFEEMSELIYSDSGMTVKEYNRSLYPYFTNQNQSEIYRQALSKLLKAGSEGWEEETNWLVKNQIQTDSLNMVYGPTASFKSFHAIDLAACVSTGSPWGDSEVMEGAVLYIAAEGNHGISKRIKAWEVGHGKPIRKLFRIAQPIALAQAEGLTIVENAINEISKNHSTPVMIVIDTVARCFGGGDENSTKDMSEFIAACDHLRNLTGAAILLVHHTGKTPTKEARGNSSLKAALDTEFRVTRKDKKTSQGVTSTGYILECTKQKDAEPQQTLFIALETVSLNESGSLNSLCRNSLPEVWNNSKSGSKKSGVQKMKVASTQSQSDCTIISSTLDDQGGTTQRETLREIFNQTLPQETTSTNKRARFSRALANLEKRGTVIIEQEGSVVTAVHEELSTD